MKKARQTFQKAIASQKTKAAKRQYALVGGPPQTAIQKLAQEAASMRDTLADPPPRGFPKIEWKEELKRQFADLLFPALWDDHQDQFLELIEAMVYQRRLRRGMVKALPGRMDAARRLRLGLLSLYGHERDSIKKILKQLDDWQIIYSDESHVRRVMKELGVGLFRPDK